MWTIMNSEMRKKTDYVISQQEMQGKFEVPATGDHLNRYFDQNADINIEKIGELSKIKLCHNYLMLISSITINNSFWIYTKSIVVCHRVSKTKTIIWHRESFIESS